MTKVTRKFLFELVWSKPMFKACSELGLSDVGLKKACLRNNIPVPPRGHWNKLRAGHKLATPSFEGEDSEIYIQSGGGLSDQAQSAKEKAKTANLTIDVDNTLSDLHPLVAGLQQVLDKRKPTKDGFIKIHAKKHFAVEVTQATSKRCLALLDAFVKASENAGGKFVRSDEGLALELEEERFPFTMFEALDKVRHIPSVTETKKLNDWMVRLKASGDSEDSYPWCYNKPIPPEWDYVPSGRLVFKFTSEADHDTRKTYGDGKKQRIEAMLPRILAHPATMVVVRSERREQRRLEDERREAERKVWQHNRNLRKLEEKRVGALGKDIELWESANKVQAYIDDLEGRIKEGLIDNASEAEEWLVWARDYAYRLNPLSKTGPVLTKLEDFAYWELNS